MTGVAESIRSFISLAVPEAIKQEVGRLQQRLKAAGGDVGWTRSSGLHLTLKFLGPVAPARIPEISEVLERVSASARRFYIKVGGLGAFPDLTSPRVLWAGMEPDPGLISFQKEIEKALQPLGFHSESRPFRPHLTLGRLRSMREKGALIRLMEKEASWTAGEWEFTEICLMKSELKPEGAVYTRSWHRTLA